MYHRDVVGRMPWTAVWDCQVCGRKVGVPADCPCGAQCAEGVYE